VKEAVVDMINKGLTQDAIATWAKTKNIKTSVQSGVKSSEQLPLDLLDKFSKLGVGKKMLVDMGKSISVLAITALKAEPVMENAASTSIQEYLNNSRKKETLENEIKNLKTGAKIEYFGEFQPSAKGIPETKAVPAESAGKVAETPKAPDMSKGISGLK
jgi:hypothetical protein